MSPERRRRLAVDGGLVALAAVAIFFSLRNFSAPYANKTQSPTALLVTLVVLIGGMALGTVVRLASGRRDSLRQWIHRSVAGALLLTPAAMVLTRTYLAVGWDFSDCGTLLFPYRPAGADLVGFRTACDVAADKLTLRLLLWVGFGVLVAYGYGLWRKYRRRARPQPTPAGFLRNYLSDSTGSRPASMSAAGAGRPNRKPWANE